jgi:hypothetical protein
MRKKLLICSLIVCLIVSQVSLVGYADDKEVQYEEESIEETLTSEDETTSSEEESSEEETTSSEEESSEEETTDLDEEIETEEFLYEDELDSDIMLFSADSEPYDLSSTVYAYYDANTGKLQINCYDNEGEIYLSNWLKLKDSIGNSVKSIEFYKQIYLPVYADSFF